MSSESDASAQGETVIVDQSSVACDGGDGPLGHPRVYLTMEKDGHTDCPYCGCRFEMAEGAGGGGH